ncbi:MAG: DUF1573 domain-containing protein [Candidatus Hatepunaea meridiana]|nr:DUF1573 domain-containing protein [Candidatus Hatepunaea meridiana]
MKTSTFPLNLFQRVCFSGILLLITFALSTSSLLAQDPEHFNPVRRTGNNMSILIQEALLNDVDLAEDDEIGIFTEAGLCVGACVIIEPGELVGPAAWADNDPDDGEIDGYIQGEDIYLRFWSREQDHEWPAEIFNYREGPREFRHNELLVCSFAAETALVGWPFDYEHGFGNVQVDESAEWVFDITNFKEDDLTITDITVEGDYFGSDFEDEVTLEYLESFEVTVSFSPEDDGEFEAVLTIFTNDEDEEETEITLSGVSFGPPHISLSDEEHNFGEVDAGDAVDWDQFFVTNDGYETLIISDITFEDEAFSTSFVEDIEIEPDDREPIVVTFAPEDSGEFATDMVITSNDPDNEEITVHLTGIGVLVELPEIELDENQHFFSEVRIDDTARWTLVINNIGNVNLIVSDIESTDDAFTIDFEDEVTIQPDEQFEIEVTFTPEEETQYDSELHIETNDPEEEDYTICYLRGHGMEEMEGYFHYYRTDASHVLLVESATINDEELEEGDEIGVFTESGLCAGFGIVPENGRTGFAGWADDDFEDNIINGFMNDEELSFKLWDVDAEIETWAEPEFLSGPRVFAIQGVTRLNLTAEVEPQPRIELSGNAHNFGQVFIDENEEWTFTIINRGDGDLIISELSSNQDVYNVDYDGDDEIVLRENQRIEITITFVPDAEQRFEGRLTIRSNDQRHPVLYIDLDGLGIEIPPPVIELDAENHFFAVQHINPENPFEFVFEISNEGESGLNITRINRQGSAVFNTSFDQEIVIDPNESFEVIITFNPSEAQQYDATFTIDSNDPYNGEVEFPVRGFGSDSEDHFLNLPTEEVHNITVSEAYLRFPDNEEADLSNNDEIAVFTPSGLCVGRVTIEENEDIIFNAYGSNPENEFVDGFNANEEMTFLIWDWSRGEELSCEEVEYIDGPENFTNDGETTIILGSEIILPEQRIASDPEAFDFGAVRVDDEAECTISIYNSGGRTLVIDDVTTNLNVLTHSFDGEQVELEADEALELTVTFSPEEERAYAGGLIVIHSNDPDDPQFPIHITGMGSDAEDHYDNYESGSSHWILVQLLFDGEPASRDDQIGVFIPDGLCAGRGIVTNPEERLGVSAYGDDPETPHLLEGFRNDEEITFRVWDESVDSELSGDDLEIEVHMGSLNWAANAFTLVIIDVQTGIGFLPVFPPEVDEGETMEFEITIINAPDNLEIEFINPNILNGLGEWTLEDFIFTWETNFDAGRDEPYELEFRVFDRDDEDVQDFGIAMVYVNNIPRPPVINDQLRDEIFGDDNQFTIEEDVGWSMVVEDMRELFVSPEELDMRFRYRLGDPNVVDQRVRGADDELPYSYWIRINPANRNWFGEIECSIIADDEQDNRDGSNRRLRLVNGGINTDQFVIATDQHSNRQIPRRDLTAGYNFTLIVEPVDDPPELWDPINNRPYPDDEEIIIRISENDEFRIGMEVRDIDNDVAEMTWTIATRGGLPEPVDDNWSFTDNEDGSALFIWTPGFNDSREESYRPVFQVDYPDGGRDRLTADITVLNINRRPEILGRLNDIEINEDPDPRRTVIADLDTIFVDPDNEGLNYRLNNALPALNIFIDNENVLAIEPNDNFNLPDGIEITVTANDPEPDDFYLSESFNLIINPVNDAPEPFSLISPENETFIERDNYNVSFEWEESIDIDDDEMLYNLFIEVFYAAEEVDTILTFEDINTTGLTIRNLDSLLIDIGVVVYREDIIFSVLWWVDANDSELTTRSSERWLLAIPVPQDVLSEGIGLPAEFTLCQNYPNPFNPSTTIEFALPRHSNVRLSVWNTSGRLLDVITSGQLPAGRYKATWIANNLPTGVYIFRLETNECKLTMKGILLR